MACVPVASIAYAEPLLVSVVLSERDGSYGEFSAALQDSLANSGVKLSILDTTQSLPNSSLVIAVGMKAALYATQSNAPFVLNVMISKSAYQRLMREFPGRVNTPSFSTIYLDQPIERQLALIAAAFPGRENVGLLFNSPVPAEVSELRQKASEYGLSLYEEEIQDGSMFEPLQKVLKHSDVLLALPDPAVYNSATLRNILVSTYQAHIPLVGFSSAYVKAGAICAVFSSPAQFASQAGMVVLKFIETGALPPAQYPKFFEIAVNDRVAQSLAINIKSPNELARSMTTFRKRMP
jgi:ABC-type uncharacterized transport system substrate-binding protein